MMAQSGTFPYHQTRSVQVPERPYVGRDLSRVVVLPMKKNALADVEKALTAERVNVWFPKFKVTYELSLKQTLKKMGLTDAFSLSADFSGMGGTQELHLQDVVHRAFVDVNEKGTEAAAAGAVVGLRSAGSPQPKVYDFRADHPFLCLIRDNRSECVLFVGRVSHPKG